MREEVERDIEQESLEAKLIRAFSSPFSRSKLNIYVNGTNVNYKKERRVKNVEGWLKIVCYNENQKS